MKIIGIHSIFIFAFFYWSILDTSAQCNSPVVFNVPGEHTFFVPAGVNSLEIEVWGAGAGGGGRNTNGTGGGGGGGAYSRSEINVVPGTVYTISVGAGGHSDTNGGDSWVAPSEAITNKMVLAKGGLSPGINNIVGGLGGSSVNGLGTFRFSGGNGANALANSGGGGGSSAGIGIDGNTSLDQNGAIAPVGGGSGGNGATGNNQNGNSPNTPPGGGGGGARGTSQSGGVGSNGRVRISYSCQFFVGGTLVDDGAITGTTIIEFASNGVNNWTAPKGLVEFEVFVVGGGGGGGFGNAAGGGGAGGVRIANFTNINNGQGFAEDTEFVLNVGGGGGGAGNANVRGSNGTPSIFGQNTEYVAIAGGGGGGASNLNVNGNNGFFDNASGGGASGMNSPGVANGGGYGGSTGLNSDTGGGGGGFGGPGTAGTIESGPGVNVTATGGNGGIGFSSDFRGNTVIYAAGGGGNTNAGSSSVRNNGGLGGSGVGGNANVSGMGGVGGSPGSGGGAGGSVRGGSGQTGVVIIKYPNFRILPVEYLYFDANFRREEKLVELKWATAKEWENSHFEIQRSLHNVKNWESIGTVDGVGWSDSPSDYLFKDYNLPLIGGMAYYRLKQVDFNRNFDLSKAISVRLPSLQHFEGVWRVFPNPNDGEKFSLELFDEEEYGGEILRVRLISPTTSGSTFRSEDLREISEFLRGQLANSAKGVYIIEVSWGQKVEYLKVLKK